jgi:DNA-binding transcriptional MerR regulator
MGSAQLPGFGINLLTPKEASKLLKVSISTLRLWKRQRKGPPVTQVGPAVVRYNAEALRKYIEEQTQNE